MTDREPQRAPTGSERAVQPDLDTWSLLWVPVVVCVALLLFIALQPASGSTRVREPEQASVQCQPSQKVASSSC
ncbi:MAG TPA: hypothetical protein VFP89_08745 [Propionibacteriaceae bacterium]|nr:hypothetical protein [Propionibacteriaceae bacterium]